MSSKKPKRCFVPMCGNTSINRADKHFIRVPSKPPERVRLWFHAVGRHVTKTVSYCCEDHFNLSEDSDNYMAFKLLANSLRMKRGVIPHLNLKRTCYLESQLSDSVRKRKRQNQREASMFARQRFSAKPTCPSNKSDHPAERVTINLVDCERSTTPENLYSISPDSVRLPISSKTNCDETWLKNNDIDQESEKKSVTILKRIMHPGVSVPFVNRCDRKELSVNFELMIDTNLVVSDTIVPTVDLCDVQEEPSRVNFESKADTNDLTSEIDNSTREPWQNQQDLYEEMPEDLNYIIPETDIPSGCFYGVEDDPLSVDLQLREDVNEDQSCVELESRKYTHYAQLSMSTGRGNQSDENLKPLPKETPESNRSILQDDTADRVPTHRVAHAENCRCRREMTEEEKRVRLEVQAENRRRRLESETPEARRARSELEAANRRRYRERRKIINKESHTENDTEDRLIQCLPKASEPVQEINRSNNISNSPRLGQQQIRNELTRPYIRCKSSRHPRRLTQHCIVRSCRRNKLKNPELNFFTLPTTLERKRWFQICGYRRVYYNVDCAVCERHFDLQEDIDHNQSTKLRIKEGVYPHKNLYDISQRTLRKKAKTTTDNNVAITDMLKTRLGNLLIPVLKFSSENNFEKPVSELVQGQKDLKRNDLTTAVQPVGVLAATTIKQDKAPVLSCQEHSYARIEDHIEAVILKDCEEGTPVLNNGLVEDTDYVMTVTYRSANNPKRKTFANKATRIENRCKQETSIGTTFRPYVNHMSTQTECCYSCGDYD